MINERAKYTANTGVATISTANSNRDGSGSVVSVITGASSGTLVRTITIKSTENTTSGMVRLYCYNASDTFLFAEVNVRATTKSSEDHSFYAILNLNFKLASGNQIMASTEKAETFIITADGLDWTY